MELLHPLSNSSNNNNNSIHLPTSVDHPFHHQKTTMSSRTSTAALVAVAGAHLLLMGVEEVVDQWDTKVVDLQLQLALYTIITTTSLTVVTYIIFRLLWEYFWRSLCNIFFKLLNFPLHLFKTSNVSAELSAWIQSFILWKILHLNK